MQFQLSDHFKKDQNSLIQQNQVICENYMQQTVQNEIKKQGQLFQIPDTKRDNIAQHHHIQQSFISDNKRSIEDNQKQCVSQLASQNADEYIKRVTINDNDTVVFSSKILSEKRDASQINRFMNDSEIQVNNQMNKLEDNLIERKLIINTKYQNIMFLDHYQLIPSDETKIFKLKMELMEQQHKQEISKIQSQYQYEKNQLKNKLSQYEMHIQQQQQVINNFEVLQNQQNHETHAKFYKNIELKDIQIQQMQLLIEQKQKNYEDVEKQMKLQLQINDCLKSQLEHFVKYQQVQQQQQGSLSPNVQTNTQVQKDIIKFEDTQNTDELNIQHQLSQNMQTFSQKPYAVQNKSFYQQSQNFETQQINTSIRNIIPPQQSIQEEQLGEQVNQQKTINSQFCNFQFTSKQESEKPDIIQFNQSQSPISRSITLTNNNSQSFIPQKISQTAIFPLQQSYNQQPLEIKHEQNLDEAQSNLSLHDDIVISNGQQIQNISSYSDKQLQAMKEISSINNESTEKIKNQSASNSEYEEIKSVKQSAKNVPKNFIKAFKSFMNSVGEKAVIQNLKNYNSTDEYENLRKKLNNIVKYNKINNEMIVYLIQDLEFSDVFSFFLTNRGTSWIEESQIKDKDIHSKYLERYIKAFTDSKYLGKIKINQKKNHKPIVVPDYLN
ncbi:hypothetical protein ABPG74_005820 [Tetrahymena malaccensis]